MIRLANLCAEIYPPAALVSLGGAVRRFGRILQLEEPGSWVRRPTVNSNRWIPVVVGPAVVVLAAVAVTVLVSGGWGLVTLEAGAVGLLLVVFLREQRSDAGSEPGDDVS